MAKQSAYSMINVSAVLDRRDIKGLWDGDDAIVVSMNADVGTGLVGAAGESIFSVTTDQSAEISIKLMHTSPTHRFLLQKLKQQRARGGAFPGFSFAFKDRVSGEGGVADICRIMTAPEDSKGTNAVVREWVLWTGEWIPEIPNV